MTQTYPTISSTKLVRPKAKKVPKKVKSETHFCPKKKGKKCNCPKRHH